MKNKTEAKNPTAAAVALRVPDETVDAAIAVAVEQIPFDAGRLEAMRSVYMKLTLTGSPDDPTLKEVTEARKTAKTKRLEVEKVRAELKAGVLRYGRAIDEAARVFREGLEEIEAHLKAQEAAHKARIEAEKRKAEIAQQEEIRRRTRLLREVQSDALVHEFENLEADAFDAFLAEQTEIHNARVLREQKERERAEAEARKLEEERAKLAAERAELEALRKADEERKAAEAMEKGPDAGELVKARCATVDVPLEPTTRIEGNPTGEVVEDELPGGWAVGPGSADETPASAAKSRDKIVQDGLAAVVALIRESSGVYGLHANGEGATWESLRTGGSLEGWLHDFDLALDAMGVPR